MSSDIIIFNYYVIIMSGSLKSDTGQIFHDDPKDTMILDKSCVLFSTTLLFLLALL